MYVKTKTIHGLFANSQALLKLSPVIRQAEEHNGITARREYDDNVCRVAVLFLYT